MSMAGCAWSLEEMAHLRGYICPSCAAEIICDDTTVATSCPYCSNPTVIPGRFTGQLKPDYVLPFKLDKNTALVTLNKFYKRKKFLPKSFAAKSHIEEIKGIYVPFWLFDGESEATMRFRGTKVRKYVQGDYEITDTEYWRVTREGNVAFEKVPVDGSSKISDAHMDAIEPFEYSELKPFSSAYLPGYLADKYDVDAETCSKRANERIRNSTENAFTSTISGYSTLIREFSNIYLKKGEVKYVFMPVWLLSTKWSGNDYLFAMNGQTGKLIGDLPVDKGRYWSWFFKIAAPLAAVLAAIIFSGGRLF
jgi:DNA-directed RNA polymerase subunit RPC12/RpoP